MKSVALCLIAVFSHYSRPIKLLAKNVDRTH